MNYVEAFRDPDKARALVAVCREAGRRLADEGRTACFMEVCGSHTMAIARHGIRALLPSNVRLISGPGCPVCVTGTGYLDAAMDLALRGKVLVTFGDLVRVPGSLGSLADARADGARVEVAYGPKRVLELAEGEPWQEFVFLAIGFETTVAPILATLRDAIARRLDNVTFLIAFKRVPPALDALIRDPQLELDGFLCPPHVSAILGAEAFRCFVERDRMPCVVAGFEPLDILHGTHALLAQVVQHTARLENVYERVVRPWGNRIALELIDRFLEPVDTTWRGLGPLPGSGWALRDGFAHWDAARRYAVQVEREEPETGCRCGEVLKGKLEPRQCLLFGKACTPSHPVGACMVSSEGSCAAAHRYGGDA